MHWKINLYGQKQTFNISGVSIFELNGIVRKCPESKCSLWLLVILSKLPLRTVNISTYVQYINNGRLGCFPAFLHGSHLENSWNFAIFFQGRGKLWERQLFSLYSWTLAKNNYVLQKQPTDWESFCARLYEERDNSIQWINL